MNAVKVCRPTQTVPLGTRCRLADVGANADASITTWSSSFHASKMRLGNSFHTINQLPLRTENFQQQTLSTFIFRLSKDLNCKHTSFVNNMLTFERCELRKYWRQNMTSPVNKVSSKMSSFYQFSLTESLPCLCLKFDCNSMRDNRVIKKTARVVFLLKHGV